MDITQFHKERDAAHRYQTESLDLEETEAMSVAADRLQQPEVLAERAQLLEQLGRSIDALSDREKLILKLYYVEELNLKEIGSVLEVTESRVSQILSALVRKLRAEL
jgi:RNA polymerase sigma factor for flagellar operon FliA